MKQILKFALFFALLSSSLSAQEVKFTEFIDNQILQIEKMNDYNVTKSDIKKLLQVQEKGFQKVINKLMANKNSYVKDTKTYDKEIFAIKKIITLNRRAGNSYAVKRDEILLKSYLVVKSQSNMIKNILQGLDLPTKEEFENILNSSVAKNQATLQELYEEDFSQLFKEKNSSKILKDAQANLREFYALKDLNTAIIGHIYHFKNRMYRLNKYAKYHMV